MMEGELFLAPGFPLPGNMDYNSYHQVTNPLCLLAFSAHTCTVTCASCGGPAMLDLRGAGNL